MFWIVEKIIIRYEFSTIYASNINTKYPPPLSASLRLSVHTPTTLLLLTFISASRSSHWLSCNMAIQPTYRRNNMNIFKVLGLITESTAVVITGACEVVEVGVDMLKDVVYMGKATTHTMLSETVEESDMTLEELEASLRTSAVDKLKAESAAKKAAKALAGAK